MNYGDLILILNVQEGNVLNSATTIDERPKLASAPRRIPHGKCNILAAACFEAISSEAYRSNHRNLKSERTYTPR